MKLHTLFFLILLLPETCNAMIHYKLHEQIDETIDNLEKNKKTVPTKYGDAYFLEDEANVAEAVDCHGCFMSAAAMLCSENQIAKSVFAISTLIFSTDLLLTSLKKFQLQITSKQFKDKQFKKGSHHQD